MTFTEIADGVLVVDVPMAKHLSTTVVALVGEDTVLIDSGTAVDGPAAVWATIAFRGLPAVRQIICTHFHHDHTGGLRELTGSGEAGAGGVRVVAHAAECGLIQNPAAFAGALRSAGFATPVPTSEGVAVEAILDGYTTDVGGRSWEAVHVPGHTWGHLAMWSATDRILIAGDAVQGFGVPFHGVAGQGTGAPYYVDARAYRGSLARMRALDPSVLVLAHANPAWAGTVLTGAEVTEALELSMVEVDRVEAIVLESVERDGFDVAAATTRLSAAYGSVPTVQAELTVRAHLLDLRANRPR